MLYLPTQALAHAVPCAWNSPTPNAFHDGVNSYSPCKTEPQCFPSLDEGFLLEFHGSHTNHAKGQMSVSLFEHSL